MSTAREGTGGRLCFVAESGTDVRLANGLGERGGVTIVARRIPGGAEVSHPPGDGVTLVVGPSGRAAFALFAARHLVDRRGDYDAVVVQGYGLAALAVNVAARVCGIDTTMLVCSPAEAYYECRRLQPSPGKPYRWWEALMIRATAMANGLAGRRYIVLSRHLAEVVRAHTRRRPVEVVPVYGVDTSLFVPAASRLAVRAALGLPDTGAIVFFSSRIAPEKDSETLLRAVKQLLDDGVDLWVLHRSGGYRQFMERASRMGVGAHVIATDAARPDDGLVASYQASDLCVQASLAEGLGFSPLEALACEVPVVAAAVGGLAETIRDGETGWTYSVGNAGELAGQIRTVLADRTEALRRARNGRREVARHFDRQLVFDRFFAVVGKPRLAAQLVEPLVRTSGHPSGR